jgi:hypothetical protein
MRVLTIGLVVLASAFAATAQMNVAQAKSVKWVCYAPDPTTPWIQICYPTTNRP